MTPELLEVVLSRLDKIEQNVVDIKDKLSEKLHIVETDITMMKSKICDHVEKCEKKHSWGTKILLPVIIAVLGGSGMLFVNWLLQKLG